MICIIVALLKLCKLCYYFSESRHIYMFQLSGRETSITRKTRWLLLSPYPVVIVIALPLLGGLVFGAVLGCFSESNAALQLIKDYSYSDIETHAFLHAIWHCVRFLLCIAVFSTSTLGVFLIPSMAFLRGFFLSGVVSVSFQAQAFRGMLHTAFSFGIPALLSLPAFLLASMDGWYLSRDLAGYALKRNGTLVSGGIQLNSSHLVLISLFTLSEATYTYFLLPWLLSLFS